MISWRLFSRTIIANDTFDDPVYLREVKHHPVWYRVAQRITLPDDIRAALMIVGGLMWAIVVLYVGNLLVFLFPPLILFMFSIVLLVGPLIAEERAKRSWETLLTVPSAVDELLLSKVSGALWWTRHSMFAMTALLTVIAAGVAFVSLGLIPVDARMIDEGSEFFLCGAVIVFPALSFTVFLVERIQYYALMVVAALAAGSGASSVRTASAAASIAVFTLWIVECVTFWLLLAWQPGAMFWYKTRVLSLATAGPIVSFVVELNTSAALLYTLATLLVRELVIGILWRVAVRHARLGSR